MRNSNLVEENISFVYYLIKKYYPTYIGDEDLVQVGCLALCKAADTWDESKSKFSTYASKCIRNDINKELNQRKKQSGVLSLDYEVTNDDGDSGTFGDFFVGQQDVGFVDIESLTKSCSTIDLEIINLKKQGLSAVEIADKLNCSSQVIQKRLRNIIRIWRDTV